LGLDISSKWRPLFLRGGDESDAGATPFILPRLTTLVLDYGVDDDDSCRLALPSILIIMRAAPNLRRLTVNKPGRIAQEAEA